MVVKFLVFSDPAACIFCFRSTFVLIITRPLHMHSTLCEIAHVVRIVLVSIQIDSGLAVCR